jgi:hypothetical protein
MHAFGAACNHPTDVVTRLSWLPGDVEIMLYAALAPADLSVTGTGCAGSNSRLRDTAQVLTFADRVIGVLNAERRIRWVNFWNELKGYYTSGTPGSWDAGRLCRDYISFAERLKAARPDVQVGGPYSTGQYGQNEQGELDERTRYIHQTFIDRVVKVRPELVDFICWDFNDGARHRSLTTFYETRGVTMPHWNTEWYPGGHATSNPPSAAKFHADLADMAANPLMAGVLAWGSGTDGTMKTRLWDSNGNPTAYWSVVREFAG